MCGECMKYVYIRGQISREMKVYGALGARSGMTGIPRASGGKGMGGVRYPG